MFSSDYGDLNFINIGGGDIDEFLYGSTVATYHAPVLLTDSDILGEKGQSIYALLSVLKGYNNKIKEINSSDFDRIVNVIKLDDNYNSKLNEILSQLWILELEKRKLSTRYESDKKQLEKDLANRKVKTLTYPKE